MILQTTFSFPTLPYTQDEKEMKETTWVFYSLSFQIELKLLIVV